MLLALFLILTVLCVLGWLTAYDLGKDNERLRNNWFAEMKTSRKLLKRLMAERGEAFVGDDDDDDDDIGMAPRRLTEPEEYPEMDGVEDRYQESL